MPDLGVMIEMPLKGTFLFLSLILFAYLLIFLAFFHFMWCIVYEFYILFWMWLPIVIYFPFLMLATFPTLKKLKCFLKMRQLIFRGIETRRGYLEKTNLSFLLVLALVYKGLNCVQVIFNVYFFNNVS